MITLTLISGPNLLELCSFWPTLHLYSAIMIGLLRVYILTENKYNYELQQSVVFGESILLKQKNVWRPYCAEIVDRTTFPVIGISGLQMI